MPQKFIIWLEHTSPEDKDQVGEKALVLGSLARNYLPVPSGFVVTKRAYVSFLQKDNLDRKISKILETLNAQDPEDLLAKSNEIKKLIRSSKFPDELSAELFSFHKDLEPQGFLFKKPHALKIHADRQAPVSVTGEANLADAIRNSWARQFDPQFVHELLDKPAHLIVQSEISGGETVTFFGADPKTGEKSKMLLVHGDNRYEVSRQNPALIDSPVLNSQKLPRELLNEMITLFLELEKHHFFPLSAELRFQDGRIHIVGISPLTFATEQKIEQSVAADSIIRIEEPALTGLPTSPGRKTAPAKFAKTPHEAVRKLRHGEILIVEETSEAFLPALQRAVGVITTKGDRFSHAARFARKRGIPSVIVSNIPESLRDGYVLTLNGTTGEVIA